MDKGLVNDGALGGRDARKTRRRRRRRRKRGGAKGLGNEHE